MGALSGAAGAFWTAETASLWYLGNVVANRVTSAGCLAPADALRWSNSLADRGSYPLRAIAFMSAPPPPPPPPSRTDPRALARVPGPRSPAR